jgi:hypothetical protein
METPAYPVPPNASSRFGTCLWCHQRTPQADVMRNHGLCRLCAEAAGDLGWRLIYDRDRNIGAIPSNLLDAYGS